GDGLKGVRLRELGARVRLPGTGPEGQPVDLDVRDFLEQGLTTTAAVDFAVARVANRRAVGRVGWHRGPDGALALTEPPEREEPGDGPVDGFALIVREGEFRVPVEVEFEFKDGSRERVTWDGQARYHLFTWPGRQLVGVEIDPDDKLLLEGERLDNRVQVAGRRRPDGVTEPVARFSEALNLAVLGGLGL